MPKTGIFKFKTNLTVTEKLPEERKSIKIINNGCYRIYDKALKKLLLQFSKNTKDSTIYNQTPKIAKIKITTKER